MKPFVVVVGASLLGCAPAKLPNVNPPPPSLPAWDAVTSEHPPGATNPPYPVLVVARDSGRCFKAWRGGMKPPSADVRNAGGVVVATLPEALEILRGGAEVACPEGQPARLLAAWDQKDALPK
ncbi:MAG: hypothetical protein EXR71_17850 [Myxococcales bacterium]|nr:hypothetical protein [Myxococcales bacterium]